MQMSVSVSGCHTVHSSKSMLISMLIKECVYPSPQVRAAQYLLFHAFCLIPKLIFDKVSCILTFTKSSLLTKFLAPSSGAQVVTMCVCPSARHNLCPSGLSQGLF